MPAKRYFLLLILLALNRVATTPPGTVQVAQRYEAAFPGKPQRFTDTEYLNYTQYSQAGVLGGRVCA